MKTSAFVSAIAFMTAAFGLCDRVVWADGMRCGKRLVSDGDSMYLVQARCGQPDDATHWVEYRAVRVRVGNIWVDRTVEVKYERWTYDFGTDRLIRYALFEDGRLVRVETGPYGEKDS